MRYDYDPDHVLLRPGPLTLNYRSAIRQCRTLATIIRRRRGTIQSVDRAARILKALASGPRRLGVSRARRPARPSRPTVHGLLQTLQAHGFVEQDRDSDKYQLGAGLLQLGNSYLDLNELRGRSLVHAERLATRTGAAVRVGVMHGAARDRGAPRLPPRRRVPGARGRRPAARPRERARQGDARLRARRGRRRPDRRAAAEAHQPDAHRDGAAGGARRRSASAAWRASATRRCSASRASRRRSSTTPATRSARSASSATPSELLPRGPAKGARAGGHRGGARRLARARRAALAGCVTTLSRCGIAISRFLLDSVLLSSLYP